MSKAKQHVSIVVPMHNESENLEPLYAELVRCTEKLPYTFEFILVDDGSRDDSVAKARRLVKRDARVKLLVLARNFGKEPAVSAGIHASTGDAVIVMDADLQHPPKLIKEFITKWQAGAEVVIGVREYSKKESWFKKFASAWFYRIMQRIAHTQITPHASDYRLLDRMVVDEFNQLNEHNRINRGLIDWLGFERDYVQFVAPLRNAGEASYTLQKLIGLAISSVTAYSMVPLRIAGYLGVFILLVAAPATFFVIFEKYIFNDPWHLHFTGTAALAFMLLFLVGVILACIGLVALYIAQIHAEVINRPLYIVRKTESTSEQPKN